MNKKLMKIAKQAFDISDKFVKALPHFDGGGVHEKRRLLNLLIGILLMNKYKYMLDMGPVKIKKEKTTFKSKYDNYMYENIQWIKENLNIWNIEEKLINKEYMLIVITRNEL
jgi:hypothetical protein